MTPSPRQLHATPIANRPPPTLFQRAHLALFNLTFTALVLVLFSFQLVSIPLWSAQKFIKEAFVSTLVLIVAVFGPSTVVLTAERGGGLDLERIVRRDERGEVVGITLERQAVWVSNHQMYADWIYPWIVLSYAGLASGLVIVLKASLEWAPLVGPAMQLFHFCFINKTTKTLPQSNLARVAADAKRRNDPYCCLLFPEGTLYSSLTRPKSRAYAETLGMPDAEHVLLPRSLGLFYTLTTLRATFGPSLVLYDLTLGYAGVPPQGYAQDYYRLQSIFGMRVPPPRVHMHLDRIKVDDVPLASREECDAWLRTRWARKDELMRRFGDEGRFPSEEGARPAELRIRLRAVDVLRLAVAAGAMAALGVAVKGAWRRWA